MRSPITALLWESWRVMRFDILVRITCAMVFAGAALGASHIFVEAADALAKIALILLLLIGSVSDASLKAFPYRLGFVRPIRTWVLVAVPMLLVSFVSAWVYIISAIILNSLTDASMPLFAAAALVALAAFVLTASSWWTDNDGARVATQCLTLASVYILYKVIYPADQSAYDFSPSAWESMFDFSLANYALFVFIAIAALSLTIRGVKRQRHVGEWDVIRYDIRGNLSFASAPSWVNSLLRIVCLQNDTYISAKCPTGSSLRAQVWFEVKTVSWEVLSVGLVTMLAIPPFFMLISFLDLFSGLVLLTIFTAPIIPLLAALKALFPLQERNRWSLSSFDAAFPVRSTPLVGLKIAIAVASILIAVIGVDTSIWLSFDLVAGVEQEFAHLKPAYLDLYHGHSAMRLTVVGTFIICQLATLVACLIVVRMFSLLYIRRVALVTLGALLYSMALLFANEKEFISSRAFEAHVWGIIAALICMTLAVYYKAWADRTMSASNLVWAGVLAIAYVVVHVAFVSGLGEQNVGVALQYLSFALALIPVTAIALAPWSVDLLRHRYS